MLQWIRTGVPLHLTRTPRYFNLKTKFLSEDLTRWEMDVLPKYAALGALVPCAPSWQQGFSSRIFFIEKPDKSHRLITDLRPLNQYITPPSFKLPQVGGISEVWESPCFAAAWDLADAFFHLCVCAPHLPYLQINVQGQAYQLLAMPFGLSSSPYYCQKWGTAALRFLRAPQLFVNQLLPATCPPPVCTHLMWLSSIQLPVFIQLYLDDVLVVHTQPQLLKEWVFAAWIWISLLGIQIRWTKSVARPQQLIRHLGIFLDLQAGRFILPPSLLQKIVFKGQQVLQEYFHPHHRRHVHKRALASFLGTCNSCAVVVRHPGLHLRPLYTQLKLERGWRARVPITRKGLAAVRWWMALPARHQSRTILPPPLSTLELATDASSTGWGGCLTDTCSTQAPLLACGFWSKKEQSTHINYLELEAVLRSLETWRGRLKRQHLRVFTDSQVVFWLLKKMDSPKEGLYQKLLSIYSFLEEQEASLCVEWIPGVDNIVPDRLSRDPVFCDWRISLVLFQALEDCLGPHTLDCCATFLSRFVSRFTSIHPEIFSEGNSLLSHCWGVENGFLNPPIAWVGRFACLLESLESVHVTVIVPAWPTRLWFRTLLRTSWCYCQVPQLPRAPGWPLTVFRLDRPLEGHRALPKALSFSGSRLSWLTSSTF